MPSLHRPRRSYKPKTQNKPQTYTKPKEQKKPEQYKNPTLKDSMMQGAGIGAGAALGSILINSALGSKNTNQEDLQDCANIVNKFKDCIKYNGFEQCGEVEKMLNLCVNQGTNHFNE